MTLNETVSYGNGCQGYDTRDDTTRRAKGRNSTQGEGREVPRFFFEGEVNRGAKGGFVICHRRFAFATCMEMPLVMPQQPKYVHRDEASLDASASISLQFLPPAHSSYSRRGSTAGPRISDSPPHLVRHEHDSVDKS